MKARRVSGAVAALITVAALLVPTAAAADSIRATDGSGEVGGGGTVWLCKPGVKPNPCREPLTTTIESPTGETTVKSPGFAARPKVDCFYVYPTVSEDPGHNADLSIDPEHIAIARLQAARFSRRCRVWAPMYRQATIASLASGSTAQQAEALAVAYADLRAAWHEYLGEYNDGRGVVLIGHSQGTIMLRQLIRAEIEPRRSVRRRLVSAILLGWNVTVREGEAAGGDFRLIQACKRRSQIRCVVAYSSYNETPPESSRYGRVRKSPASVAFGFPTGKGYEALCTNPAALGGGRAALTTIWRTDPHPGVIGTLNAVMHGGQPPTASTRWLMPRDNYSGECVKEAGANFLSIEPIGHSRELNPSPDANWGLHLADINIALGELLELVRRQEQTYMHVNRRRSSR